MALAPGSRLGVYEIVAQIGAGGMGEVYRARDPRLGREVAIKVLSAPGEDDGDRVRRFEREARAVAALSHPNVLAIFDVGLGDVPFLVTELLEGETLRALVERGPMPWARTLELSQQLLAGLDGAHARGIVHRDLKPENIFVTTEGRLKILDFGLARQTEKLAAAGESTTRVQTLRGTLMGTVGYMAPEQVCGRDADHRADIFAFGTILFEMLTGRRAYSRGSPAESMSAILTEPASTLRLADDTPASFVDVVRRCLEKHPLDRFQSARDVALAMDTAQAAAPAEPHARHQRATPSDERSIAVLPLTNMSRDPDDQYFSDGLAEELIISLTRLTGLRVASRTSSFRFRGQAADVRTIGRDLGVDAILEGSVRRAGPRVRIAVQLTDAVGGFHIWSERYDRQMADMFEVQDEIVASIVRALAPALLPHASVRVRRPTENLDAYELYLKGRHFWSQRSPAVMSSAIRCFEEAIALDAHYALAYAGLADCYSILRAYGWTPREHGERRALDAVEHALTLDPELPEAHFSKALQVFHFERQWRRARSHFVNALALDPRMTMAEAYLALFLAAEYAYPEATQHLDRALELDRHSAVVLLHAASASCVMGDVAAVERHARRALELQPESLGAWWPLTIALSAAGRVDDAITAAEELVNRSRAAMYLGVLGMAYALGGRTTDVSRLLQELDERQHCGEYIVPLAHLAIHVGLHDVARVRSYLALCADGGAAPSSVVVLIRPFIDRYRGSPDIDAILDRLQDGARALARPPSSAP